MQIALADPDWGGVIRGFAPTTEILRNPDMLYLALGILGATVMPHNLYLHSAIVQTRAFGPSEPEKREAIRLATIDSTVALMLALLINASILILAAASFNAGGHTDVAELGKAHLLLNPLLGSSLAPTLFAIALLACGLNSTVTATLAGQAVMEGFIDIHLPPWLRRLITRAIAIVPAALVTIYYGEAGTGQLLIGSQVILSLQLPFAVVPLVLFTADRSKLGEPRRAEMDDGCRNRGRGGDHRTQLEAAVRFGDGVTGAAALLQPAHQPFAPANRTGICRIVLRVSDWGVRWFIAGAVINGEGILDSDLSIREGSSIPCCLCQACWPGNSSRRWTHPRTRHAGKNLRSRNRSTHSPDRVR